MSDAVQAFQEVYNRHFLPQGKELTKPARFPGVGTAKTIRKRLDEDDDALDVEVPEDERDDVADADDRERDTDDDDSDEGTVETRCSACGELNEVMPPDGHEFEFSTKENDNDLKRVQFKCSSCGEVQRLRSHRARRIQESATGTFHAAYRRGDHARPVAHEADAAFREVYDRPRIRLSPSGVQVISAFLQSYHRR